MGRAGFEPASFTPWVAGLQPAHFSLLHTDPYLHCWRAPIAPRSSAPPHKRRADGAPQRHHQRRASSRAGSTHSCFGWASARGTRCRRWTTQARAFGNRFMAYRSPSTASMPSRMCSHEPQSPDRLVNWNRVIVRQVSSVPHRSQQVLQKECAATERHRQRRSLEPVSCSRFPRQSPDSTSRNLLTRPAAFQSMTYRFPSGSKQTACGAVNTPSTHCSGGTPFCAHCAWSGLSPR